MLIFDGTKWKDAPASAVSNGADYNAPLSITSNTVSISQSGVGTDGFLSTTDWNTFNGKENVLSFNSPLSRSVDAISLNTVTVPFGGTGIVTTTAYGIITGGTTATGSFQNVGSLGTSGQVLTSSGAASLPTWTTIGGGGGLEVGVTAITSGTANRFLFEDGSNVLQENVALTFDGTDLNFSPSGLFTIGSVTTTITNPLGIGTAAPTAKLHIVGTGTTSATYWLKGDNSSGTPMLYGKNDGLLEFGDYLTLNDMVVGNRATFNILDDTLRFQSTSTNFIEILPTRTDFHGQISIINTDGLTLDKTGGTSERMKILVDNVEVNHIQSVNTDLVISTGGGGITERMRVTFDGIVKLSARLSEVQGADIASATNITLGFDGNSFELTGTTQVDLLTSTGWQEGSAITLIANESVTIADAVATAGAAVTILLDGSANFSMTAQDTLTLKLLSTTAGGQAWIEVGRTVI